MLFLLCIDMTTSADTLPVIFFQEEDYHVLDKLENEWKCGVKGGLSQAEWEDSFVRWLLSDPLRVQQRCFSKFMTKKEKGTIGWPYAVVEGGGEGEGEGGGGGDDAEAQKAAVAAVLASVDSGEDMVVYNWVHRVVLLYFGYCFAQPKAGVIARVKCVGDVGGGKEKMFYVVVKNRGSGKWSFPKGGFEPGLDMDLTRTALREFEEETGCSVKKIGEDDLLATSMWMNIKGVRYLHIDLTLEKHFQLLMDMLLYKTTEIEEVRIVELDKLNSIGSSTWAYKQVVCRLHKEGEV